MIEIFELSKRYGDHLALDGLSLRVNPGEVLGFLGPNGSGKTTTIRLLMGLLRPSAGRAAIMGLDCHADAVVLKRVIGYVPDEPFLYPYLSGFELLEMVSGLHGFSGSEARRRARTEGERFIGPDAGRLIASYSLGTRKRLALAMALIHRPKVLILDEPTSALDPRAAHDMWDVVTAAAREGTTVFLSTHLVDSAERFCHRIAILHAGRLRGVGTLSELRVELGAAPDASLEALFLRATAEPPVGDRVDSMAASVVG